MPFSKDGLPIVGRVNTRRGNQRYGNFHSTTASVSNFIFSDKTKNLKNVFLDIAIYMFALEWVDQGLVLDLWQENYWLIKLTLTLMIRTEEEYYPQFKN